MAVSIDNYLQRLSRKYYLKNNSDEVKRIESSIKRLLTKLNDEFGKSIKKPFIFGSYDRDTILPRVFDPQSDVDLMVIFKHKNPATTPEMYRQLLRNFAYKHYKDRYGTKVVNSSPTVTIRLKNITYDLVPAKEEKLFNRRALSIPGKDGWQTTDPNDVKKKLKGANTRYGQIVRPIVRLLKAWNCKAGYPYDSYLLELKIANIFFFNHSVESGLFYAIEQLHPTWEDTKTKKKQIESLKYNIDKAKAALNEDKLERAKHWLHKVFPKPPQNKKSHRGSPK